MKRRWLSVRWKLAALIVVVVLLITGLDAWLVPQRAAEEAHQDLEQRAKAAAAMLANSTLAAVEFEQADTAAENLSYALADPLVAWAAIYRPGGGRFVAIGNGTPERMPAVLGAEVNSGVVTASAALKAGGNHIGSVVLAMRSDGVGERRDHTRRAIAIQGLLVAVVGILLAFFASRPMSYSIREMARVAALIARGDVSAELHLTRSNDELGDMARAFEHMNQSLRNLRHTARRVAEGDLTSDIDGDGELFTAFRQMIQSLRQLTERIAASSEALASAAAGMFAAVREQGSLASQQTASLEEIRRTLETLANAAETVAEDADSVREMSALTLESSQGMTEHTRLVSTHSESIGEILTLIQDIADRSDLLALNAALEGTKAGEVGRGFSLVAAEMRRLSEHVMDSVRDIRKLVADMRAASHSSVLATEESTKLANQTASSAAKISEAAKRQQEGTHQAKSAADEIVRAVNAFLAGTNETTRSAESLLELSRELKGVLRTFRTSDRRPAPSLED